jgi:hypothetical protein
MPRHRDAEDWRTSQMDSGRSSDYVGSGFTHAPRGSAALKRRRKASAKRWIVGVGSLLMAGLLAALLRAFFRR